KQSRIASLARASGARFVRLVLGFAGVVGHLRGNGQGRLAEILWLHPRAGHHRPADFWTLAIERFSKKRTSLETGIGRRETPRPGQLRALSVSLLAQR